MKYVSLIRRRRELSRTAFRDYYEQRHAPLALQFFPPQLYQRNHLLDEDLQLFDCLSEFDYADDFDPMQVLATEAGEILAQDEIQFMQREAVRSASTRLLSPKQPEGQGARQRELWLLSEPSSQLSDASWLQWFAALGQGCAANLYVLQPYYCEQFPYRVLVTWESPAPLSIPALPADVLLTRCKVLSCPSPTENNFD